MLTRQKEKWKWREEKKKVKTLNITVNSIFLDLSDGEVDFSEQPMSRTHNINRKLEWGLAAFPYIKAILNFTIKEVPRLIPEKEESQQKKIISYLFIRRGRKSK